MRTLSLLSDTDDALDSDVIRGKIGGAEEGLSKFITIRGQYTSNSFQNQGYGHGGLVIYVQDSDESIDI